MANSLADPWASGKVIWSGEAFLAASDFIVLGVKAESDPLLFIPINDSVFTFLQVNCLS